jgi:hypothetical protein
MSRSRKAKPQKGAMRRPVEPASSTPSNPWYTVSQLCTAWGCTRATLYAKHLPHMTTIMFGGRRRIERSEADRYYQSLSDPAGSIGQGRRSDPRPAA